MGARGGGKARERLEGERGGEGRGGKAAYL